VYSDGLPADGIFVLKTGSISLTRSDALGNARIVRLVLPGGVFGLDSLLPNRIRFFTAVAREDSKICFVSSSEFEREVRQDKEKLWKLVLLLDLLAHEGEVEKIEISGQQMQRRLRNVLSRFGSAFGNRAGDKNGIARIRQWELAQFLGTSEETISRELKKLNHAHSSENISAPKRKTTPTAL
jgi:CRP/FNR family transcriptional regulator, cyclic AMP receptor protein